MEEFFKKLNKGFTKAAKKIDVWTQIGQLKIEKRKIASKLKVVYGQLGKEVYKYFEEEGYSEIKKEEVSANLTQIEEYLQKQIELTEKIELLKAEEKEKHEEETDI